MTTVLALRALGLGDALTGIPALRGLRRAHPDARLVLAAPAGVGGFLASFGIADEVLDTAGLQPLRWTGEPPDVAVNLHGRGPQSQRLLQQVRPRRTVAFACPEAGHRDGPPWPIHAHEVDRWCGLVQWAGGDCSPDDLRLPGRREESHVVLHPGAASGSRRWPVDRWAAVAAGLAGRGREVVVTGVPAEADLCARVAAAHPGVRNACGASSLAELADLVASAALVLCGDTGIAHVATAFGTPSVLLFGPVSPDHWGPRIDADRHRVLWHPHVGDPAGDPHADRTDLRLVRVQVDEVLAAAEAQLAVASVG
ncbi:ADP-heptose:LPS heptosyltransferase [Pedococcus cremeus]|uniref:ADP-heptose:LPS heptosyltransferase n=1 Tax=Pedococcus cremeus TaxID=587636 RepID=A0A1H9QXG9_9MICO|nr:glycosyltransferase family 9 protein [Pedococcus cremeus]SER65148.1 ADP-heptose:LPS heptosyltransferase [Pedococcus cremeus]